MNDDDIYAIRYSNSAELWDNNWFDNERTTDINNWQQPVDVNGQHGHQFTDHRLDNALFSILYW